MAYWNRYKDCADGFDQTLTQVELDSMKEKLDEVLKLAGSSVFKSSEMNYEEYKGAMAICSIAKSLIEVERAKVDALSEIIDSIEQLDDRLDDIERKLEDKD